MKLSILVAQAFLSLILAAPVTSKPESGSISASADGSLLYGDTNVAPANKVVNMAKRRYDDCYEPEPPVNCERSYEPEYYRHPPHYYDDPYGCYDDEYEPRHGRCRSYDRCEVDEDGFDEDGSGCCCGGGLFNAVRDAACALCPSNWCAGGRSGGNGGDCCCRDRDNGSERGCRGTRDREHSRYGDVCRPEYGSPHYGCAPYHPSSPPPYSPPGYDQPLIYPPPPVCNHYGVPPYHYPGGPAGPVYPGPQSYGTTGQQSHEPHAEGTSQPTTPQGQPQGQQPLPQGAGSSQTGAQDTRPAQYDFGSDQQGPNAPTGMQSAQNAVRYDDFDIPGPISRYHNYYDDDFYPYSRGIDEPSPRLRRPYYDDGYAFDDIDDEYDDDFLSRARIQPKRKSSRSRKPGNSNKKKAPASTVDEQHHEIVSDPEEDGRDFEDDADNSFSDDGDIHFDVSVQRRT